MNMSCGSLLYFGRRQFASSKITGALVSVLFVFALSEWASTCPTAYADEATGWILVWSDEFDGPKGSAVNGSKWSFDLGGRGWGNNELETYTSRTANAQIAGARWS
jgi:hypothetical protein